VLLFYAQYSQCHSLTRLEPDSTSDQMDDNDKAATSQQMTTRSGRSFGICQLGGERGFQRPEGTPFPPAAPLATSPTVGDMECQLPAESDVTFIRPEGFPFTEGSVPFNIVEWLQINLEFDLMEVHPSCRWRTTWDLDPFNNITRYRVIVLSKITTHSINVIVLILQYSSDPTVLSMITICRLLQPVEPE